VVVPGRFPYTAQEATHETHDGLANHDSSLTRTLRVPQSATSNGPNLIEEKLAICLAMLKVKARTSYSTALYH
jgi:hypothetical protein